MDDPELKALIKKSLFAVAVALAFAIPAFLFFTNKLYVKDSDIVKSIKNNKGILIFVTENKCSNCNTIKKELKDVKYKVLNKSTDKNYNEIMIRLGLENSNIEIPALIYVKKGELYSFIENINSEEELNKYLENYK